MRYSVNKAAWWAAAVCLVWALAGAGWAGEHVDQTLNVEPAGTVHIHCLRGELTIVGWDRPEVRVQGELDDLATGLRFETDGDRTMIRIVMPEHGVNRGDAADLTVNVPGGAHLRVDAVSAEVHLREVTGPVAIRTVSGDVSAEGLGDRVQINTTSGDIELSGGAGGEGLVRIGTTSGDTRVRLHTLTLRLDSVSGDIEAELEAFDAIRASTVSGDFELAGELASGGSLEANSVNGDVELELAAPVNAAVEIRTGAGGDIDNDWTEDAPETLMTRGKTLRTTAGDGSGRVLVQSISGDIELRHR
jgi:hypothetical protein